MYDGNAIPGDVWYYSLWSFVCFSLDEVKQACSRCTIVSILEATLKILCLPCCIVRNVLGVEQPRSGKFGHSRIVYLYILLCSTIVLNLWQVIKKSSIQSTTHHLVDIYITIYMWVSIIVLLDQIRRTFRAGGGIVFDRENMPLTFYLRTGLYVFGILSFGYHLCRFINYVACKDKCCINTSTHVIKTILEITKSLFIFIQIFFLNSFYQIKLSVDTPRIQIALAHVLGTNLSLWFYTLCLEVHNPGKEICTSFPTPVGININKFFYPIFVEYYLLAASMFYEIWSNLKETRSRSSDIMTGLIDSDGQNYGAVDNQRRDLRREDARSPARAGRGNGSSSLVFGLSFGVVFLVFVIASSHVGKIDQLFYDIFVWVTIVGYLMQIVICFILHICIQTQRDSARSTCDYDDALLYIGLAGVVLWDGFHFYDLFWSSITLYIDEVLVDFLGPVQYLTQTVTLVIIRRSRSSNDTNSKWICHCALFLLATNFATWCQDTFFIEGSTLEKPGENHPQPDDQFEVLGHILNPLIIFFRFQSATCCYQVWTLFNGRNAE